MGKKDTNAKPAAPAKRAAKPAAASAPVGAKKAAAPTKPAKPAAAPKRAAKKAPALTTDDVALRAYFIAEKRRRHGLPGDEHQDWIEAERQLRAESKAPRKAAR